MSQPSLVTKMSFSLLMVVLTLSPLGFSKHHPLCIERWLCFLINGWPNYACLEQRPSKISWQADALNIFIFYRTSLPHLIVCFINKKSELKLTSAYELTRFVFRSWQERSVHACQRHHRTVLLTGECHPLWLAWHPEDAAKTEGRMANPEHWGKYCISFASQIPRLQPGMSGETDVTVRLLRHPWCDLPRGVLISYLTGWVISASLDSEKEKIILWFGKASDVYST